MLIFSDINYLIVLKNDIILIKIQILGLYSIIFNYYLSMPNE